LGSKKGNGPTTVFYEVDGDASDWLLSTYGILATSPELAIYDRRSFDFYIDNRSVVLDVLQ